MSRITGHAAVGIRSRLTIAITPLFFLLFLVADSRRRLHVYPAQQRATRRRPSQRHCQSLYLKAVASISCLVKKYLDNFYPSRQIRLRNFGFKNLIDSAQYGMPCRSVLSVRSSLSSNSVCDLVVAGSRIPAHESPQSANFSIRPMSFSGKGKFQARWG